MPETAPGALPRTIIDPKEATRRYWGDLLQYRELFVILAWRDISVRYKQTAIGVSWAFIQPFLTMVLLSIVFGRFAGMPSEGVPYPILVFAAVLPWQFFASAMGNASNSLISNANLLTKVYFPRLIVPTASVVTAFIDFLISSLIFVGLMIWYQYVPPWTILFTPFLLLVVFLFSLGPGLWFASMNVRYRDFRYVVPFCIQFGLYASPVGYATGVVPAAWQPFFALNPMVGVIDGFRWALLGQPLPLNPILYLPSIVLTLVAFWLGIVFFRRTERIFADII